MVVKERDQTTQRCRAGNPSRHTHGTASNTSSYHSSMMRKTGEVGSRSQYYQRDQSASRSSFTYSSEVSSELITLPDNSTSRHKQKRQSRDQGGNSSMEEGNIFSQVLSIFGYPLSKTSTTEQFKRGQKRKHGNIESITPTKKKKIQQI